MPEDAGQEMKARLRADLRTAMKEKRTTDAQVIRALVAAIDNAEAPAISADQVAPAPHSFHSGSAEVERLLLTKSQVRDVLMAEIHERERVAAELEHRSMLDRAKTLRAEVAIAKRYLE